MSAILQESQPFASDYKESLVLAQSMGASHGAFAGRFLMIVRAFARDAKQRSSRDGAN
jgi:hypothetical protein